MGALQNVEKGQFGAALHDIANWVEGREAFLAEQFPALEALAEKVANDEKGVIVNAITAAGKDVQDGGYSADAFIKGAKDALGVIVSQGVPIAIGDVFTLLNLETTKLQNAAATAEASAADATV